MARELPIHNGRMTTDLDANGFKIKNLPPGSGFTQAQADWNQEDATAPDFIKNKPEIPAAVTVDPALATPGAAADAKAVGDALRGGFTEWEFSGPDVQSGHEYTVVFENGFTCLYDGNSKLSQIGELLTDETSIDFETGMPAVYIAATRHAFPPTKTSQLTNDGDGTNAFVKTNDTRLSDARTPTVHAHAMSDVTGLNAALAQKASMTDLPYRLVEPGKWELSGEAEGQTVESISWDGLNERWVCVVSDGGSPVTVYVGDAGEAAVSLRIREIGIDITATRASLPGHLLDRAVNAVSVTGATTLTLPALENVGKARDFLVKVTTSADDLNITWQGQGSEAPNGADELRFVTEDGDFPVVGTAGDYLFSFTEVEAHTFAVSMKPLVAAPQAQGGS